MTLRERLRKPVSRWSVWVTLTLEGLMMLAPIARAAIYGQ